MNTYRTHTGGVAYRLKANRDDGVWSMLLSIGAGMLLWVMLLVFLRGIR